MIFTIFLNIAVFTASAEAFDAAGNTAWDSGGDPASDTGEDTGPSDPKPGSYLGAPGCACGSVESGDSRAPGILSAALLAGALYAQRRSGVRIRPAS